MYISQLVINGFKTFNSKTSLEFGDGITAVVGPNGCGKTNIVDAIRWVLGEQKYSTLRSARMEDIIFNGAKGTKPTSMCEVYLTVKNDKGKLPIDYADVEVGRRLYRDGESDYSINRTSCRLKDVNNLFVDTGMGADSYSVIELKMIEQILSESDEGRKFLFEEAAGINKYKTQRRLSIRKFEATKFDLERINDIIAEVDGKVKSLNLQLKRYKRHAVLVDKLKNKELDLSTLQINRYLQLAEPLRKKIDEFSHIRSTKVSDQDLNEAELTKLRKIYNSQESEIKTIRNELQVNDRNREETRQRIIIWQEQNNSAEQNIGRLKAETNTNKSRIENYTNSIKEISKETDTVIPKIDEKLSIFKLQQEEFDKIDSTYKNDQKIVDNIQGERWELQKGLSDSQSLVISSDSSIKERNLQEEKLIARIASEEKLIEKLVIDEKGLSTIRNGSAEKNKKLVDDKNILNHKLNQLSQAINSFSLEKQSQLAKKEHLSNQLQFYNELVTSQSDLPSGLKYVLDHKLKSDSIMGTIAELLSTDQKYEAAISASLGELANALICKNRVTAIELLNSIKNENAGKISLIPIDEVNKITSKFPDIPINKFIIGRASELVKHKNEFSSLIELLLGKTLVVTNIDDVIIDNKLAGWTLIDLSGSSFNEDIILKSPSSATATTIGRKNKIDNLKLAIKDLDNSTDNIDKKLTNLTEDKVYVTNQIKSIDVELINENKSFEKINTDLQRIKFEIENKNSFVNESKSEVKDIIKSIDDLQKSLKIINHEVDKSDKKISIIQRKLDDGNERLQESRKKRDMHHQGIQDIRIELLNLENNRDNLNIQKKTAENTISEIQDRHNTIINEIQKIEEQSKERAERVHAKEKELVSVTAKLKKNRSILELKEQAYRETYRSIEEIENKIKSEQKSRETILEELKQCEIAITEFKQKISSVKERILDKYEEKVPHSNNIDFSEPELESEIYKLDRGIENIGPVNMAVQVEFEEEERRRDHLTNQRDDLVKSEEHLRDSIEKIDRVARKQFRETFDQIKVNFENLFTIFFEGGQGTLELIGNPDPLEAEIAIRAQPPGKRNQTLRMLSAGEKSLTAIALLFAIYQYKPSPYCILDEVDAPLDDTNVRKFTRALKSFTKDTQFIVVTHNKLTMEAADYLYGVTMEKKGVSKLVSVKFD